MRQLIFALAVVCAACGSSSSTPAAPSTSTSTVAQVGGNWTVTLRLTSVTGGECVGPLLQDGIGGTYSGTLSVTQTGANLTATFRSSDGPSCSYTGTASTNSMALSGTCTAPGLTGLRCANGALRDLRMSEVINATVSGRTATGTVVTTYAVVVANTQTSVGTLTTNESLTGTLQ